MCSVSMVMDYGRKDFWPYWQQQAPVPWIQQYPPNTLQPVPPVDAGISEERLRAFLKLYEAAKEYDAKTAQPDCEDPAKMQVLDRILERLDAIEQRLGDGGSDA